MATFPTTRWSRLKHRLNRNRGPQERIISAFGARPAILMIVNGHDYHELFRAAAGREVIFLVAFHWHWEGVGPVRSLAERVKRHVRAHPGRRFVFLCNTSVQQERFAEAGLEAHFINHHALVDERVFRIDPTVPKRFDALYDARIAPFKRHELAARVRSLALIAYLLPKPGDREYGEEVSRLLPDAHWFVNPLAPDYAGPIDAVEVCEAINACGVGLCLSAKEGAMYASVQYLLCGLPVVSTRSLGGRDVFFDPEFVRIVEDDPVAVKEAVDELKGGDISPQEIRERTLARMMEHRGRLIDLVRDIHRQAGVGWKYPEDWDRVYFNKMIRSYDLTAIPERLDRGLLPVPPKDIFPSR